MPLFPRRAEHELQLILEASPNGVVIVDGAGGITRINAQTERLFGQSRDELVGRNIELVIPDLLPELRRILGGVAGGRGPERGSQRVRSGTEIEFQARRKDGSEFAAGVIVHAISKGRGAVLSIVHLAARRQAEQSLAREQERLRLVIESAPHGILTVDGQGHIAMINAQVETLFGYTRAELVGQPVEMLVPAPLREKHERMRSVYMEQPQTRPMGAGRHLSGRRKDGSEFPVEIALTEIDSPGHNDFILATIVDITERKQAQERQQLLMREILHRTKNMMAVVQSIAQQSLVGKRTLAEARTLFINRLLALSRTDGMLVERSLEGVELQLIIKQELAGFSDHVNSQGCELLLKPAAAQNFALILHELATNAAKYGALSIPSGHIGIRCEAHDAGRLRFIWQESGGPPVRLPIKKGFGLRLLERIGATLGEPGELTFAPEGLRYELRARLEALVSMPARPNS